MAGRASASGIKLYCRSNGSAHLVLRNSFGKRIQRQQPHFRLVLGAIQPGHSRVGHFPAAASKARFGRQQHVLTLAKLVAHEWLIEPDRA
jgi:hypothetical protein